MRIIDQAADMLEHIGVQTFAAKTVIEQALGFSNDALYVIAGVLLYLIAAFVLRSSLRSFRPWLLLLGLGLANELNDMLVRGWPNRPAQLGESGKDLLLLLLLPSILMIVARTKPNLLARRA